VAARAAVLEVVLSFPETRRFTSAPRPKQGTAVPHNATRTRMLNHPKHVCPRTFTLTLRVLPGVDGTRALRALLKTALRKFGLRCVSAEEIPAADEGGRS
jgi:hypothetical protein